MLALELNRGTLDLAAARGQLRGHGVERFGERAKLVLALRLDALIEAPGADLARRRRQDLNRTRDPFGEIGTHPRRAEQGQQRHHQEDRQVETRHRLLQDAQLVVALECLCEATRSGGQITSQVVRGHNDSQPTAVDGLDDGGRVQEIACRSKLFDRSRIGDPSAKRAFGNTVGGRSVYPGGRSGAAMPNTGSRSGSVPAPGPTR